MSAQDYIEGRAVEGADAMLDDIKVAGLLAEIGMNFGAPSAELENAVVARTGKDG